VSLVNSAGENGSRRTNSSLSLHPFLMLALISTVGSAPQSASNCALLIGGKFADAEITKTEIVSGGAFTSPSDGKETTTFRGLPAFCRVIGTIHASSDSAIGFEIWLPDQWNGRYLQTGNGGFAGSIRYDGLVQGIQNRFAAANTDDGHTGRDWEAAWARGHPEKVVDFGYRAVHQTAIRAKQIVSSYYKRRFSHAYFSGCSDGGREALMEAQRYPDDFDGWVVGAPGNNWTGVMTYVLHLAQTASSINEPLTSIQIEALSNAALARCDALDGVADGVIGDPLGCAFDPAELQCGLHPHAKCLSAEQVDAIRRIYEPPRALRAHTTLTPGLQGSLGAESGQWEWMITGAVAPKSGLSEPLAQKFAASFWADLVYNNSRVDIRTLDLLEAVKKSRALLGAQLNAVDPDLSAVRASGKKIIQYHGWADVFTPAQYSIAYYRAVATYLGRDNRDFYRLFMAPGMGHCFGGPSANVFGGAYVLGGPFDPEHHALAALIQWVESGRAPERIVATKYQDDDPAKAIVRTRPLCPYPRVARWQGSGSTDDARNFICSTK
jgi:Tannase and feruloyl esterase